MTEPVLVSPVFTLLPWLPFELSPRIEANQVLVDVAEVDVDVVEA